jgi:hypothetical protein
LVLSSEVDVLAADRGERGLFERDPESSAAFAWASRAAFAGRLVVVGAASSPGREAPGRREDGLRYRVSVRSLRCGLDGTKLGAQQAGSHQLPHPLSVTDVGRAPKNVLLVPHLAQRQLEVVTQNMPHRHPVHAVRLHRDMSHALSRQLAVQRDQPLHPGPELSDLRPASRTHTHAVTCALRTSSASARSMIVAIEPPRLSANRRRPAGLQNRRV